MSGSRYEKLIERRLVLAVVVKGGSTKYCTMVVHKRVKIRIESYLWRGIILQGIRRCTFSKEDYINVTRHVTVSSYAFRRADLHSFSILSLTFF